MPNQTTLAPTMRAAIWSQTIGFFIPLLFTSNYMYNGYCLQYGRSGPNDAVEALYLWTGFPFLRIIPPIILDYKTKSRVI